MNLQDFINPRISGLMTLLFLAGYIKYNTMFSNILYNVKMSKTLKS